MVVGAATGLVGFLIHSGPRIVTKMTSLSKITTTFDTAMRILERLGIQSSFVKI
jgi:hypothetical protein